MFIDFKYNLNKLIQETERSLSIKAIEKMLEREYRIPVATFRRHRAIKRDDATTIKEDHLAIYAKFFNITPEELRNYELRMDKTLKELKSQTRKDFKKSLKLEIGLSKKAS